MQKVLKNVDPLIRSYLGDAFCFSIISEEAFETGWVYDKYIHLEFVPSDGQIKYADYDYYDFVPDQGLFIKSFIEYPYTFCNSEKIVDLIKEMLDNNEYCFALWDETIITNYLYHEKEERIYEHGCFIYGYDSEREMFFTEGYFDNEKWGKYTIPYDIFYKAISYCPQKGEIAFVGYKLRPNYEWKLDDEKVKYELKMYRKNSLEPVNNNRYDLNGIVHFFSNSLPGRPIHYPSLYCIYEQKCILWKRLVYLKEIGWSISKDNLEMAQKLYKTGRKVMLFGISYNNSLSDLSWKTLMQEAAVFISLEKDLLDTPPFL